MDKGVRAGIAIDVNVFMGCTVCRVTHTEHLHGCCIQPPSVITSLCEHVQTHKEATPLPLAHKQWTEKTQHHPTLRWRRPTACQKVAPCPAPHPCVTLCSCLAGSLPTCLASPYTGRGERAGQHITWQTLGVEQGDKDQLVHLHCQHTDDIQWKRPISMHWEIWRFELSRSLKAKMHV